METLKNKTYIQTNYLNRYNNIPFYYDSLRKRHVCGIGGSIKKDISFSVHNVSQVDTLDSLALKYYNNPTFWWVIAMFNDLTDPFIDLSTTLKTIKIPALAEVVIEVK